jgi:hypothetical protein
VAPVFNKVDYIRRLRQVSVEVQRIRSNTTPQAQELKKEAMQSSAVLVGHGMVQARLVTPEADRDDFVAQMRKIIASSGMPMPTHLRNSDVDPVKPAGTRTTTGVAEMIFEDRLPRFMKKWEEGDPEWRLLESPFVCSAMKPTSSAWPRPANRSIQSSMARMVATIRRERWR